MAKLMDSVVKTVMGLLGIKDKPPATAPATAPQPPLITRPVTRPVRTIEDTALVPREIARSASKVMPEAPTIARSPPMPPVPLPSAPKPRAPARIEPKLTSAVSDTPLRTSIDTKIALVPQPKKSPTQPPAAKMSTTSKMGLMLDQPKKKKRRRTKRLSTTARTIAKKIDSIAKHEGRKQSTEKVAERLARRLMRDDEPTQERSGRGGNRGSGSVINIPEGTMVTVGPPGMQSMNAAPQAPPQPVETLEETIVITRGALQSLERDYFKHLLSSDEYRKRSAELLSRLRELEEKKKVRDEKAGVSPPPAPSARPSPAVNVYPTAQAPPPAVPPLGEPKAPAEPLRAKIEVDTITAKNITLPKGERAPIVVPMYGPSAPAAGVSPAPSGPAPPAISTTLQETKSGNGPKPPAAASRKAPSAPTGGPQAPKAVAAPSVMQAPVVVHVSPTISKRVIHYEAEQTDEKKSADTKAQVWDPALPRPEFAGRNIEAEFAQAQVTAARGTERERLEIEQVKRSIEENFKGKVDEAQLKSLTENVQKMLESHKIQTNLIKDRLDKADQGQLLDSFMALVRMIEEQRPKTESIGVVAEEFRDFTTNLKKEVPKAQSRELENKELITDYDKILDVVREKGKIPLDTLAKAVGMDKKSMRDILDVLEKEGLLDVQYPAFGQPVVIDLLAKRKKEGS
jgi:DNA-binding Lrp family transcriptional regulator